MASGKPFIRQTAWVSLIPQLLFMALLCVIYVSLMESVLFAVYLALITYLIISFVLRFSIPHNHRKGIALTKANKYENAIEEFEKSYAFFSKHNWVDKYRFITMLSSTKISYLEMALVNIAFCYTQIGDGKSAKEYYLKTLEQFPDSEIAKASLKVIESAENHDKR